MAHDSGTYFNDLISGALNGDESAWGEIINLVTPVIFGICGTYQFSREETYDIFGQVCYLLLTRLKGLKNPKALIQYVATTTRHEVITAAKRRKKQADLLVMGKIQISGDTPVGADKAFEDNQFRESLMTAIGSLPEREAHLLTMLFLDPEEPSYEEIARRLQIPVSSIGPTRARGIKRLQKVIKKMGIKLFGIFLVISCLYIFR